MNIQKALDEINKHMKKEEFVEHVKEIVEKINKEKFTSEKLERESTLTYKDGQKVLMKDMFRVEDEDFGDWGELSYVKRINEDNTLNIYIGGHVGLCLTDVLFDSKRSILVQRDAVLDDPLGIIITESKER